MDGCGLQDTPDCPSTLATRAERKGSGTDHDFHNESQGYFPQDVPTSGGGVGAVDQCTSRNEQIGNAAVGNVLLSNDNEPLAITTKSAACELGASFVCGLTFVTRVLPFKIFLASIAVGLGIYVITLACAGVLKATLKSQGIRKPSINSKRFWHPAAFGIAGVIVNALCAMLSPAHRMPYVSAHVAISLAVYPFYGWVQEWLVQGFITRNLAALLHTKMLLFQSRFKRQIVVCIVSALSFSAVHYPDIPTCYVIAIKGVLDAGLFQRDADIFPLGLWHGWLATFWYYWARGFDPLRGLM